MLMHLFAASWTCPDGIGFDKWTCQPGASPQSPIDLPISFGEALNHFASVARGAIDVSFDNNITSDVTFPASGGVVRPARSAPRCAPPCSQRAVVRQCGHDQRRARHR